MTPLSLQALLADRFRAGFERDYPEESLSLSGEAGFFRYGDLCLYGRNREGLTGRHAGAEAPALRRDTGMSFAPAEVLENLLREKYLPRRDEQSPFDPRSLVRRMYYALRPLMPVSFRKHLQRRALSGWRDIPFPQWPVDLTVDRLYEVLLADFMTAHRIDSLPFIGFWPEGKRGCVTMTHDVETAAGVEYCRDLAMMDADHGFASSFQFIPELRYDVPRALLEELRSIGAEVNVHGLNHDGHLFDNHEEFLRRAERINRHARDFGARGFRSPVLYRNPEWFSALDFDYEMSIPNVGHLDPQRGGCCTVFPYFIGDLVEIPLTTIQDYSLFNVLGDYSIDLWRKQLDIIVGEAGGMACFNVHPDYLVSEREKGVYLELLRYLREQVDARDLWAASPGEIADWWWLRVGLGLVRDGSAWRIDGVGGERAQVVIARRSESGVIFGVAD